MKSVSKEFVHEALVKEVFLSGRISEKDSPAEGDLKLRIDSKEANLELFCFIATEEANLFYNKVINIGDRAIVTFWLGGDYTKPIKLKNKIKSLNPVKGYHPAVHEYIAEGEIMKIYPHPSMKDSNIAILDSGVFLYVRIMKTLPLKVGDYMRQEGRLDAKIVSKFESIMK